MMADPIGEFSLKHTGNTYGTNSDGEMTSSVNFQGEATGFGTVWGTLISSNACLLYTSPSPRD